jgi:hypothetical protein
MALQASYTLTGAVPLYFVGVLVGKTMILELGPVLTGLALAGRVGANIAAEIGTMRVTEQIDALETLGYDPFAYLVVPRVLAGVLMFPVVVAFANATGILAGWITALNLLDMSTPEFVRGLRLFFVPFDVVFSLIKAASFGLAVTAIGGFFGFHTMGGAAAVGRSTTQAVVVEQHADPGAGRVLGGGAAVRRARCCAAGRGHEHRAGGVRKAFGSRVILDGVSLTVQDGETLAVIGYSGSGKSVMLKTIVRLLEADAGTVHVDGAGRGRPAAGRALRAAPPRRLRLPVRRALRLDDGLRQRRHGPAQDAAAGARARRAGRNRWRSSRWTATRTGCRRSCPAASASASASPAPLRPGRSTCSTTSRRPASTP